MENTEVINIKNILLVEDDNRRGALLQEKNVNS